MNVTRYWHDASAKYAPEQIGSQTQFVVKHLHRNITVSQPAYSILVAHDYVCTNTHTITIKQK